MPDATSREEYLVGGAVVAGTALALVSGAFGWRLLCAVGLLVALLGEPALALRCKRMRYLLRQAGAGLLVRTVLRFAAVVAVSGSGRTQSMLTTSVVVVGAAFLLVLLLGNVARLRMRRRRTPVIETRNIPLDSLDVPPAPASTLVRGEGWVRTLLEVPMLMSAALSTSSSVVWLAGSLSVVPALLVAVVTEQASRRIGERLRPDSMTPVVQDFLDRHRTQVVLYFSGDDSSRYQVEMWLSTMERLGRPAAVILRERNVLRRLAPTSLPVLCIPAATHLMALDLTHVRVALFTANVGNNIHLLRDPGLMGAFIGHGDSDKNASFNPVSRGFDEIWVAGQAGRERYRRALIGVRDEQVVEVGRPQLDLVQRRAERPPGWVPTILYAPTWEGWNADQEYGSTSSVGPLLVRAVLEHPTPVRLIYKPHPFTGRRDPAMAAAHREITAMLLAANARTGQATPPQPVRQLFNEESGDAADRAVASGRDAGRVCAVESELAQSREDAAFFAAAPPSAHVVVEAGGLTLFSCFDVADFLVTDVSSVLSDFMASGKPYAVCNPSPLDRSEFVRTFPSASAGTVVDRDGTGLDLVLDVVTGVVVDPNEGLRLRQAGHLLGEDARPATERFAAAVDALAVRAARRNEQRQLAVTAAEVDLSGAESSAADA